MGKNNFNAVHSTKMTTEDFRKLSRFITEHAGIKMPDAKKVIDRKSTRLNSSHYS